MDTTSVTLLQRVALESRDEDWRRLIAIYRPLIDSQIRRYPALKEFSEDIVQDSLVVLMTEIPRFQRQREGSFRSWLRMIVLNQLRLSLRRSQRLAATRSNLSSTLTDIDELEDPSSQASQAFEKEHDRFLFERACRLVKREVSEKQWSAFERYALLGESVEQVAKSLELSVNSVKLAKSRISARIRNEIQGFIDP